MPLSESPCFPDDYIWDQYKEKVVEPFHVTGEENPAHLFTKSLSVVKVEKFRSKIGLS